MKRLLIFACSFFLTLFSALSAGAEIVGRTAEGDFIHRYLASNGQELFFVSMEREPPVDREDVNGDGVDDLVVYTAIGASNYFVEFFVWDGEKYVMAQHGGGALANYCVTDSGYVVSYGKNGWAGALFDDRVYAWDGTDLRLVRKMVSTNETEESLENGYAVTWSSDTLHISLWDYAPTEYGPEETLLWETDANLSDMESGDLYDSLYARLWEGLEN